MITNKHISIIGTDDIHQLVALINKSYRNEDASKGWTSEKHLFTGVRTDEKTLVQLLKNKNVIILKYTTNAEKIVGCVYLEKQESQIYLGLLSVDPEFQG